MASLNEEAATKILQQVEFYFSDSNLPRDNFLMKKVSQSKDGMVGLALICSFSRIRALLGLGKIRQDDIPHLVLKSVADILRKSDFLKVSDDGKKVGRLKKLSKAEQVIEQVDVRTIAASPFQYDITMEDVASFFSKFGKVNSVRLPRHEADKRYFCGTALIEFSTDGDAADILKKSLVYAGACLELKSKKEFDSERAETTPKIGGSNHKNDASTTSNYPKGLIVAFSLKRKSVGKPVKNGGNAQLITNSGGVCKKEKNLDPNVPVVEEIENASDRNLEEPPKNPEKEKCKKIVCEQIVSQEIVNSEKTLVRSNKKNNKEIISEESDEKNLQDAICHNKDQSPENVCQEIKEKVAGEERCTTLVHEEKDVLMCEDLKDVFERFGAVKHVDYHNGALSGFVRFEEPKGAIRACAAAEFIDEGLTVKNFIVSYKAATAKTEEEYWNMHCHNQEGCQKNRNDRKRKHKSSKGGRQFEGRSSQSKENNSPTLRPTKDQKVTTA